MILDVGKRRKVLEILYGGLGKQPTLIARIQELSMKSGPASTI